MESVFTIPWKPRSPSCGIRTYTRVGIYKLKSDAPSDAVEMLSKNFIVPLMEKLLADGALVEYEVDVESIHTGSPDKIGRAHV